MMIFSTDADNADIIIEDVSYRVNFWNKPTSENLAWTLDAYILFEASDDKEVLDWVDDRIKGRQVEVFVELQHDEPTSFGEPRECDLLRLLGSNPNAVHGITADISMTARQEHG